MTKKIVKDKPANQDKLTLKAEVSARMRKLSGKASSWRSPPQTTERSEAPDSPDSAMHVGKTSEGISQVCDVPVSTDSERDLLENAITKLNGRDRVGVLADVLAAIGGGATGAAVAGTVASAAGAATLLGSTSLASLLGGVIVTSTPVGWVAGSAAVLGIASLSIARMARSGGREDNVRLEISTRLNKRLAALRAKVTEKEKVDEFSQLLTVAVALGLLTKSQGQRMTELVDRGTLDLAVAINRLTAVLTEASQDAGHG